jgi:hypothetical protein
VRPLLAAAFSLSLAVPAPAKTLVVTHPETGFDDKNQAGPRTQELLASREFREKLVLMVYADRSHYTFDPDAPGVSFRRVTSSGGQLEEDLGDTDFVVAGGFISACLQDTVTDLIQYSHARAVRFDLAGVYATVPQERFPRKLGGPRNLREYHLVAPREAEALFARVTERVYGALKRRGLGDRALELRVNGRTLGVVDHDTYSESTPGEGNAMPRLRPASGRPAFAVLSFE